MPLPLLGLRACNLPKSGLSWWTALLWASTASSSASVLSAWLASGAVAASAAATAMMEVRDFFILLSFSNYSCCKLDLVLRSRASRLEQVNWWLILGDGK